MGGFDEKVAEVDALIVTEEGKIKESERKLSYSRLELTRLLHKKKNLRYNYRGFNKTADGWITFRCISCGNRDKARNKGAKYCGECKRKHKKSRYDELGWMPYARKQESSV